jgi:Fe-S cluster biogenesis protein NfuA
MPSWFSKVFTGGAGKATPREAFGGDEPEEIERPNPILADEADEAPEAAVVEEEPRRVVQAPVLRDEEELSGWSEEIRIRGQIGKDGSSFVFLVDRPVLDGHSAWFPTAQNAAESPLADVLFGVPGVTSVLIHGFTVTVHSLPQTQEDWEPLAREIGARIRTHLKEEKPVVAESFFDGIPDADAIRDRLQLVIDTEVNPGIASHSGVIGLERVEGNTVYITMGGGCQGCAASEITLVQGIHESFRRVVPQVGAILDVTDHAAGTNPFYKELPAGMQSDA